MLNFDLIVCVEVKDRLPVIAGAERDGLLLHKGIFLRFDLVPAGWKITSHCRLSPRNRINA